MKRPFSKLLLCCFFLLPVYNYGQEEITSKPGKFQVGLFFSPDLCYRTLRANDANVFTLQLIDSRNQRETYKIGYTSGIKLLYNLNNTFAIGTGFQYSIQGYQIKTYELRPMQPEPMLPDKAKLRYDIHYLDFPIYGILTFGEGRIRYITSMGLTTNLLFNATTTNYFIWENGKTVKNRNSDMAYYNSVNLSPTFSAGVDIQANDRMNLRIEPTFRYGLLQIFEGPVKTNLWSAGLNFGYFFKM